MQVWTVHCPPVATSGRAPLLLREGFSWAALFFGPLWLLWHRQWLGLLGWLALAVGCALLPGGLAPLAGCGVQFLLAAQAQDLRRWSLSRHGWRLDGVVAARDGDHALARLLDARPALASPSLGLPA